MEAAGIVHSTAGLRWASVYLVGSSQGQLRGNGHTP